MPYTLNKTPTNNMLRFLHSGFLFLFVIKLKFVCLVFVCLFAYIPLTQAQKTKKDEVFKYKYFKSLAYLEDPSQTLGIQKVSSRAYTSKFIPAHSDYLNFGFTRSVYWVRIEFPSDKGLNGHVLELEYPLLDNIQVYQESTHGYWDVRKGGDRLPFTTRQLSFNKITFMLEHDSNSTGVYYLRFVTEGSMNIQMQLWKLSDFIKHALNQQIIFGVLFGMLFMLLIYALFVGIFLRNTLYLYFATCILASATLLSILEGYTFQYLFPAHPNLGNISMPFVASFLSFSIAHFTRRFLKTSEKAPVLHKLLFIVILSSFFTGVLSLFDNYYLYSKFAIINGVVAAILVFYTVVICRARGNVSARFAVSGCYIYVIGLFLSALESFGVIESTLITMHSLEISTLMQLILFSVSLNENFSMHAKEILKT
jgi:hypothetical protein